MQEPPAETPGSNQTPLSDELAPVVCHRKLRRLAVIVFLVLIISGKGREYWCDRPEADVVAGVHGGWCIQ
jgi:hypothetical protein